MSLGDFLKDNFKLGVAIIAAVVGGPWVGAQVALTIYGTDKARREARRANAKARAQYNSGLEARSVTTLQSVPPQRVVYGRSITGGELHAIFTTDKTGTRDNGTTYTKPDALKHLVIAIADHECEAIHEVYIDGIAVGTLDGSGQPTGGEFYKSRKVTREVTIAAGGTSTQPYAVTVLSCINTDASTTGGDSVSVVSGTYSLSAGNTVITNTTSGATISVRFTMVEPLPTVRIQKALGTASQTVNTYLNGLVPTQWTTNHRLRGIAYVILTLDLEEQRFQGGPPNVTFDVSGKKLYDPRTGLTTWSRNPALVVRDFLLSEQGYNVTTADIDDAYVTTAANVCDSLITLQVGPITLPNQPRYTCDGSFTTAQAREAVLEDLLETMAGTAVYGAKWQVMAGAWTASVMDLGDDDLHGQIEIIQGDVGMEQLVNGMRGQYVPAGKATPTDFDSYQNATFLAADGVPLWDDVELAFVNDKYRARNLSRIRVESARAGQIIRFPAKLRAWPLQVGDRVRVTSGEYGWTNKSYRVTDWQWGTTTAVILTLQEDTSGIWDLADAATADPTPNSGLPNPWNVAELTGVTATSGAANQATKEDGTLITRVRVAWDAVTDAYVADGTGQIRIEWRRQVFDAANTWRVVTVPGDEAFAMLEGVAVGNVLTIKVTAINGLGARSEPVILTHTVTGAIASVGGGNLAYNSSFEKDTDGNGVPDGYAQSYGTNIDITPSGSTVSYHAARSQVLTVNSITTPTSLDRHFLTTMQSNQIAVQPNASFYVSIHARTSNVAYQAMLGVAWYDSGNALIRVDLVRDLTFAAPSVFVRFGGKVTSPSNAAFARPRFGIKRASTTDTVTSNIRFDGLQFEAGDVMTAYAPRGEELLPGTIDTDKLGTGAATEVVEFYDATGVSYSNAA